MMTAAPSMHAPGSERSLASTVVVRALERFLCLKNLGRCLWLSAAVYLLATASVQAAPPNAADDPRAFVESLGAKVLNIIKSPNVTLSERQHRFRELFTQEFEAQTIGRFVLGAYWNRATDEQRKRYLSVFNDYVAAIYAIQFSHYEGEAFKTTGVQTVTDSDNAVQSEIDHPGKPPIQIVFRVRRTTGSFKIVDVTVEGVSLIVTKRSEFASVLNKEGLNGVIERMQTVLNKAA